MDPRHTPGPSPARQALEAELGALHEAVAAVDPADPGAAAALEARVPYGGPQVARVAALCRQGLAEGWLLPRSNAPNVRFGRLAKDLGGYAVDAVLMQGEALGHTHPRGEVNLCLAWSGAPRFHGHPPGWVVFPPGSHHVPTVTGGEMLFVYFTPGGAVLWDAPPAR